MKYKAKTMLFGVLCALIAIGITLYPLISNDLSERNKSIVRTEYTEQVEAMEDENRTTILTEAEEYNASLWSGTVSVSFSREALNTAAERYYDLLNVNASGMMGYVEIQKIGVYLPVYHGTDSDALDKGVGHLMGSSLPVGGESTHTVLTGHSGLAGEKMFSDLDQLEIGDVFYVHVLEEVMAYEVDEINVVLPEDTSHLNIERGQDLCTLVTCTPFGVNTHRLLVRGHRIAYTEAIAAPTQEMVEVAVSSWTQEYLKGIMIGVLAVTLIAIISFIVRQECRCRKRGNHEKR